MTSLSVLKARAIEAVRSTLGRFETQHRRYRGWLTAVDGSVHVSGRPGFVYVQRRDSSGAATEEIRMPDTNVPDIGGYPVIVGRTSVYRTEDVVIGRDTETESSWLYDYTMQIHAEQHAQGGFDTLWIQGRVIIPLRVSAQTTPDLTVNIEPGVYPTLTGNTWYDGATDVSMSAYIPDSGRRWVVIGINQSTDAIQFVVGSVVAKSQTLAWSDLPAIPSDLVTLAAVHMYSGQTAIVDDEDIFELRAFAGWAGTLAVQEDGVEVLDTATALNFTGDGVSVSVDGTVATILVTGGGTSIEVRDDGVLIVDGVTVLSFTGDGVSVVADGTTAIITIDAIAASSLSVQDDGVLVVDGATILNFTGDGVEVTADGTTAIIRIAAVGGITDHGDLAGLLINDHTMYANLRSVSLLRDGVVTEYDDPDQAFNDATMSGDCVLIPPGVWQLDTHHSVVDVSVIGLGGGPEDCVLQSTWNPGAKKALIQLNDSGVAMNFLIDWDPAGVVIHSQMGLYIESGCQAYYVKADVNISGGTGHAVGCNIRGYARRCVGNTYAPGGSAYGVFCYQEGRVMDCEGYAESDSPDAWDGAYGVYISKADEDSPLRGCIGIGTMGGGGGGYGLHIGSANAHDCYVAHSFFSGTTADVRVEYSDAYFYSVEYESEVVSDGGAIIHMGGDRAGKGRDETITGQWTHVHGVGPCEIESVEDGVTNQIVNILTLQHQLTGGSAAAGLGARLLYRLDDDGGTLEDAGALDVAWTNAGAAAEESFLSLKLREGGAGLAEVARLTPNALLSRNTQELNIGSTTPSDKWGHVYLSDYKDILPDDEDHAFGGLFRRFVNIRGMNLYTNHRGTGLVIPPGCTQMATPANLWAAWLAGYWGWLYGTYYGHYPNHATLPAGIQVVAADPLPLTIVDARIHVLGGCCFGIWADNYDVDRNYNAGDYVYRYDVYAYGLVCETHIYTQTATSICTVGGIGAAATFAAWVNHAVSGPYGPFGPTGNPVVLRLRANHGGTAQCYPYVLGEQGAASGMGGAQILYDDAWPGTSQYLARRMGMFQRLQGYGWSVWDWYYMQQP